MNNNKHEIVIQKMENLIKKIKATIDKTKIIHFGEKGASDFTKHQVEERKQRYINRQKKKELEQIRFQNCWIFKQTNFMEQENIKRISR